MTKRKSTKSRKAAVKGAIGSEKFIRRGATKIGSGLSKATRLSQPKKRKVKKLRRKAKRKVKKVTGLVR